MTQGLKVCADILAALDARARSDIAVWSERKEYQDIQAREAHQVLTDPQARQVSRDTVATQVSQVHQDSPEERESRENPDSQDLQLMLAMAALLFKVRPVTLVVPEYLDPAVTKELQGFQAFQESQELSQGQEHVDFPVFQGPQGQRERKVPQVSQATALRDRRGPLDCRDHQANLDQQDPPVQEWQASPSRDSLACPVPEETAADLDTKEQEVSPETVPVPGEVFRVRPDLRDHPDPTGALDFLEQRESPATEGHQGSTDCWDLLAKLDLAVAPGARERRAPRTTLLWVWG